MPTKLPSKVKKIYDNLKEVEKKRKHPLKIAVCGPKASGKTTFVKALGLDLNQVLIEMDNYSVTPSGFDLILLVMDPNQAIDEQTAFFVRKIRRSKTPFLLVVNKLETIRNFDDFLNSIKDWMVTYENVVPVGAKNGIGLIEAKQAILKKLKDKQLALCYSLPDFRGLASQKVISNTAIQNGVIGGVVFLPGADMPVLTANQIKMIIELAAIHGENLSIERAKELGAVVFAGYTLRAVARQLLDLIPGPGWILKGFIAYSGTQAMGKAATLYFERGKAIDPRS